MNEKVLVRNCLEAMMESADIEVSIKCRIGIGKEFNYDFFCNFIDEVIKSGISIIYVHARNAILSGLTTKNNTSEKIILEYFQYIKNKLYKDSIFRLLSPLLNIFFCFPNSKKFKTEIQSIMKDKKIDVLESLFLQFIDKQQININF